MKRMLADVLWDAANLALRSDTDDESGYSRYTCDAVSYCTEREQRPKVHEFLFELGLPHDACNRYDMFKAFKEGAKRQGVRYMWLLLAMHVAEDEGIEL